MATKIRAKHSPEEHRRMLSPLRGVGMAERVQITLPTRSTALTLPGRDGVGLEELMQLERADGYWLFEDGNVIVIASRTLSLLTRSLSLTLPELG